MDARVESQEQRAARQLRALADRAVDRMVDALVVARLPPLPSLEAGRVTLYRGGVHIELGGCNPHTLEAIAAHVADHARCLGRVVRTQGVPVGLAELSVVRHELRRRDET
ncbi:hypothetical protein ACFW1A_04180 [Kitasatospora sp. NPDC058965]|uniref:hypothetical protein n=1 Tax=Kitasatospora sp. NPDC058965 TaxID=3346682 RepID=UPI0036951139